MDPVGVVDDPVVALEARAHRVGCSFSDDRLLLDRLRGHDAVLLGEASHGTHEFYAERAALTRALIETGEVAAVAIEGDWPDAHRVNRFVLGQSADANAEQALRGFRRFPTWMWRNRDVLDFVAWLRTHNDGRAPADRCPVLRTRSLQPRGVDRGRDRLPGTCRPG